jgi:SAM-dependent methyltransferase
MLDSVKSYLRRAKRALRRAVSGERISRETLAREYLSGDGIEIGALHRPLVVSSRARVRFVDRMPVAQLREQYPELQALPLVPLDIVDDGEKLSTLPGGSQDFVIANHFLEHCEDPLGTVANIMRVLKPGGVFYLAVPDKRSTFDCQRLVTPIEHIVHDHDAGPAGSRIGHYEEWVHLVYGMQGDAAAAETRKLLDMNYSIHFHVWDAAAFLKFLSLAQERVGFNLELCMQHNEEVIAIVRKPGGADEAVRRQSAQSGLDVVRRK